MISLTVADGATRAPDVRTADLKLRAGEWVRVRSAEEILATLDAGQALMFDRPEMLKSADEAGIAIVGRAKVEKGQS